jgi:hypothetical protein
VDLVTNGFQQHEDDLPSAVQVVVDEGIHHMNASLWNPKLQFAN